MLPFSEAWWNAPIFYPAGNAMALADHRVGLGVITTPLIWAGASPLIAYNVAFLASFFLSAAAGYALSLAVTGHRPAAFVGGLVFGFHPFRAAHLEHVELLSSYWLAAALLCLHRWVRTRSRWPLAGLAVVLTLQALTSGYYFFYAMLLVAGWIAWFALRQSSWSQLAELTVALAAPVLAIAPVLWRYRAAHAEFGLGRSVYEVEQLSADIAGFAATPSFLAFWNLPIVPANPEVALFPGLTAIVVVMLAIGLRSDAPALPPTVAAVPPGLHRPGHRRGCRRSRSDDAGPVRLQPRADPLLGEQPLQADVGGGRLRPRVAGDAAPGPRRLGPPFAVRLLRARHAGDVAAGRRPDGAVPRRARALQGALCAG